MDMKRIDKIANFIQKKVDFVPDVLVILPIGLFFPTTKLMTF